MYEKRAGQLLEGGQETTQETPFKNGVNSAMECQSYIEKLSLQGLTNHSKYIGVIHRALLAFIQTRSMKNTSDSQTVVGSKRVDNHGAASIPNLRNTERSCIIVCVKVLTVIKEKQGSIFYNQKLSSIQF